MEIYQQPSSSSSPTSFLPHPSSSQDNFTQLTLDLSHKLTLHVELPSDEIPPSEYHVEEHQPLLQDMAKVNEAVLHEDKQEIRGGAPDDDNEDDDDDDDNDDFSFCCDRLDSSPVSAEDIFADGRIRPVFPLFNQSLLLLSDEPKAIHPLQPPLRRLFAEDGRECPRVVEEIELPSPGSCKKSNSTGSSKLCRFVDSVVTRSSSDGKDAFVFLREDKDKGVTTNNKIVGKDIGKGKGKGKKPLPSSAAKGKAATERHRSYLPYRRDLLGFFTNSNLLSKNVHPF